MPVISYLMLRGRCRACRHEIGVEAVAIELAAGMIGGAAVLMLPPSQALAAAFFGWLLLPLAILDWRHYWLPDRLTALLAACGVLFGPLLTPDAGWTDRFIGGVGGFVALEGIRQAYRRYSGRDGMGAGDPKLFAAIGLWLGWQMLPLVLLLTTMLGLSVVAAQRFAGKSHDAGVPFGAYLAAASFALSLGAVFPNM